MTLTPLYLRFRNLAAGADLKVGLDAGREARFVLGDRVVGLRFLLPNPGDTFGCRRLCLEPLALRIGLEGFAPHLTIVAYVEHDDGLIWGRASLPLGADLQILTACDLQALIGETSWRVRAPTVAASVSPTPDVGSPHRRTAKPHASGSR